MTEFRLVLVQLEATHGMLHIELGTWVLFLGVDVLLQICCRSRLPCGCTLLTLAAHFPAAIATPALLHPTSATPLVFFADSLPGRRRLRETTGHIWDVYGRRLLRQCATWTSG